jgi:hypothetical protein
MIVGLGEHAALGYRYKYNLWSAIARRSKHVCVARIQVTICTGINDIVRMHCSCWRRRSVALSAESSTECRALTVEMLDTGSCLCMSIRRTTIVSDMLTTRLKVGAQRMLR